MDALNRYYTSTDVSTILIGALNYDNPQNVLELGVGKGALAKAAFNRWSSAKFVTVDLDPTVISNCWWPDKGTKRQLSHFTQDVLDPCLHEKLGLALSSFDLAIGNPPFRRAKWREEYSHILEDAGLSGAIACHKEAGAQLLFLAQSLRLLRTSGKLGLILPDGLISGEKNYSLRKTLLQEHLVEHVIKLPTKTFLGTEAQTHLLILQKKSGATKATKISYVTDEGVISPALILDKAEAAKRLDYDYHHHSQKKIKRINTSFQQNIGGQLIKNGLFRGNIASNQIKNYESPVFHLGDFKIDPKSLHELKVPNEFTNYVPTNVVSTNARYAKAGDILIARVGRKLHLKLATVSSGAVLVSDCVFVLRPKRGKRKALLEYLFSSTGKDDRFASARGVGARYLTTSDVSNLRLK
tara:strand:+ start:3511 stop:4743 length:1233 start_codon:yes stop_codon:yes gene_type:complete